MSVTFIDFFSGIGGFHSGFEKAAEVNSNTQLYKQAGNAVTVNVVEAIGRHIVEIIQEEKK
nr:MAG TPA: Cytosine specific methyltransferase [Caudoviricetes sp.]